MQVQSALVEPSAKRRPGNVGNLAALRGAPDEALLSRADLSALTGRCIGTIRLWERQGRGPKVIRMYGKPRVSMGAYRAWLKESA
jgi:hypothetical protein